MNLQDALNQFRDEQNLHNTEGRRGLVALCRIVGALGYKDSTYFGQLDSNASIGDLINFLEDNSGAIEAITNWIEEQNIPEWTESIKAELQEQPEDEDEAS